MAAPARGGTKGVPREAREQQILDIAADEFGRAGHAHASIAAIAQRAGISKPLIYGYFESKDGLYLACLHRSGRTLVDAVGAAQNGTTAARGVATLSAIFTALEPRRHDWALLYDPTLPPDSAVLAAARPYRRALADFGAVGVAEILGDADPLDRSLLTHLWYSAVAAAVEWWQDHPNESAAAMATRCARIAERLVRPSGATPGMREPSAGSV
ncbi:MAG TPA: TetR/AcrR family transcriptional regulator [Actinokineospora sp.]|jgi:AcrR family transcriptional regulator|nr:TetR/AcrR family transcriptional regulator [Actinokineospora sp.]